jgi:uncharacterized protein (TIGR02001 family)
MSKYLLVLSAMLMALPTFADFTTNIGMATEYTFRGVKQSDKDAVLNAGVDYQGPMGLYAGAWGYTGGIEDLDASQANAYGGFAYSLGPVSIGLGVIHYVPAQAAGLTEYNLSLAWGAYRLSTFQDEDDTYQYHELGANYDVWGSNGLALTLGLLDNKDTGDETLNYGLGWVVAMEGKVDFELRVMRNDDSGNAFTIGMSKQIDW